MQAIQMAMTFASLLGAALVAGTFFAFSSFVMPALRALAGVRGLEAMQQINRSVLNTWFLGVFMGTAILSLAMIVVAAMERSVAAWWSLGAAASYLVGTFGVTVVCNVPLNNRLERVDAASEIAESAWITYARAWTRWNHVRTIASAAATVGYAASLWYGK